MSLEVGKDTYITIEQMNQYVKSYYPSTDSLRIQWEAMSEEDQEVYVRRAFEQINSLPFTGRPKNPNQALPFPRVNFTSADLLKVQNAQAEQAITLTDTVAVNEFNERIRLRRAGVSSYRIGDLSETFNGKMPSESNTTFFGLSERAYKNLSKWLKGGYAICTPKDKHRCGRLWWLPLN